MLSKSPHGLYYARLVFCCYGCKYSDVSASDAATDLYITNTGMLIGGNGARTSENYCHKGRILFNEFSVGTENSVSELVARLPYYDCFNLVGIVTSVIVSLSFL